MRGWRSLVVAVALGATGAVPMAQAGEHDALACSLCDGLSASMTTAPGQPFFLRSFEPAGDGATLAPDLENTAFTYDNALALMALYGCGRRDAAKRIADAFVLALEKDRHYLDGRLRNAYRAGPVEPGADGMLLPGYWNAEANAWSEDDYQAGSGTGVNAWGALALLAAYAETQDVVYLDGARRIMTFVHGAAADPKNPGYFGGFFGHEPAPAPLTWKSTEHNLDVYAADRWLAEIAADGDWGKHADSAKAFLDAMWAADDGHFHIGTVAGSNAPNTKSSGLDAQLWPLLAVPDFKARASQVLGWTEANHGVPGGFDFDTDRDGIWLEGTAQAALTYQAIGVPEKADPLFATIAAQVSPQKLVYATSGAQLTTGLDVGPSAAFGEFKYYRLPHIGATAWAVLAALDVNPFTPEAFADETAKLPCSPGE